MNPQMIFERVMRDSIAVKEKSLEQCGASVTQVVEAFLKALPDGKKILLCGNGGSASDALHVAGELVGRFLVERRALPAIALTADSAILTCVGNDYAFAEIFARQVEALALPGDIVVGISTSGNSPNIVRALEAARKAGAVTIGFTGETGGKVAQLADICVCVPSTVTARIQETHIAIWHAVCESIDRVLAAV